MKAKLGWFWLLSSLELLISCKTTVPRDPNPSNEKKQEILTSNPHLHEHSEDEAVVDGSKLTLSFFNLATTTLAGSKYPLVTFNNDLAANYVKLHYCVDQLCKDVTIAGRDYFIVTNFTQGATITASAQSCVSSFVAKDPSEPCGKPTTTASLQATFAPGNAQVTTALQAYFASLDTLNSLSQDLLSLVASAQALQTRCPPTQGGQEILLSDSEVKALLTIDSGDLTALLTGKDSRMLDSAIQAEIPFTYDNYLSLDTKERIVAGQILAQKNYRFNADKHLVDARGTLIAKQDFLKQISKGSSEYEKKLANDYKKIDETNTSSLIIIGAGAVATTAVGVAVSQQKEISDIKKEGKKRQLDAEIKSLDNKASKEANAQYSKKVQDIYQSKTQQDLRSSTIKRNVAVGVAASGALVAFLAYQGTFSLSEGAIECKELRESFSKLAQLKEKIIQQKDLLAQHTQTLKSKLTAHK